MEGQARVLQHRVQPLAVRRRGGGAQEGVGSEQDEAEKADRDHALHRQHQGAQGWGQIVAETGDRGATQRKHEHPKQHGAFMIAPNAGDFVK